MKFCKHRRVTYEKVLQSGLWFRASCGDCQRSGAFEDSQDKALAKLQCVQATVRPIKSLFAAASGTTASTISGGGPKCCCCCGRIDLRSVRNTNAGD